MAGPTRRDFISSSAAAMAGLMVARWAAAQAAKPLTGCDYVVDLAKNWNIVRPMLASRYHRLHHCMFHYVRNNWDTLDSARDKMMPEFQEGMKKNGFVLLGSGDVGLARTMSKGRAIKSPDDLKAMKVYAWQDDLIAPKIASEIGYTPVLSSVPGLLPALSAGRINVITVPALAATQLQWWSHLDHVNENVAGVGIGGSGLVSGDPFTRDVLSRSSWRR